MNNNTKFTCVKPTPWDVAIHRASNYTTSGIEPLHTHTITRRELQPGESGRITLKKNRYKDEKE